MIRLRPIIAYFVAIPTLLPWTAPTLAIHTHKLNLDD